MRPGLKVEKFATIVRGLARLKNPELALQFFAKQISGFPEVNCIHVVYEGFSCSLNAQGKGRSISTKVDELLKAFLNESPRYQYPVLLSSRSKGRKFRRLTRVIGDHCCQSFIMAPIRVRGVLRGHVLCGLEHHLIITHVAIDFLSSLVVVLEQALDASDTQRQLEYSRTSHKDYNRLLKYGNILVLKLNHAFKIVEILGDSRGILGQDRIELLESGANFRSLVERSDLRAFLKKVNAMRTRPRKISAELRVKNQSTGEVRWLLVRIVPSYSNTLKFSGLEAVCLDITESRNIHERVEKQKSRIEALFEVSRSLQSNLDPAFISLKGVEALVKACKCDSGLAIEYKKSKETLEIIAATGLSEEYISGLQKALKGDTLARMVVNLRQLVVVPDLQLEPKAAFELAKKEGLRGTLLAPLMHGDQVLGALVFFSKEASRFGKGDTDLISAAASQIAVSMHRAHLFSKQERQARWLSALYNLSHELSLPVSVEEIAKKAFGIMHKEFAFRRFWLGVMNESGSKLVGKAGLGPGMRGKPEEVELEVSGLNGVLANLFKDREIIVCSSSDMKSKDLESLQNRFRFSAMILVPLVSLGQIVGVLALEPLIANSKYVGDRLPLLKSMAGEVANVLWARRLEHRVIDVEKMRTATLMASGVAHNFNNLLQAILGQVSLLEIRASDRPEVQESTVALKSAVSRGSELVRHLLSISRQSEFNPKKIKTREMFEMSHALYRSLVGEKVALKFELEEDGALVNVDLASMQQVMANLLINATEAVRSKSSPEISVRSFVRALEYGSIDPDLHPGQYLVIEVEDNGGGMSLEEEERCFEPFFTTKAVDAMTGLGFQGSGLGLAAAYSIVKQHKGMLTVRSLEGEGSTFSVFLPIVDGATSNSSLMNGTVHTTGASFGNAAINVGSR